MTRISQVGPAILVAGTLVAALFAGPATIRGVVNASTRADIAKASARLEEGNVLEAISLAQRDIAIVVEPSVVHVSSQGSVDAGSRFGKFASTGSGWLWDELGHVVTNAHVVEAADRIEIQLHDGEVREGRIIGLDLRSDIAVVKVEAGNLIPAIRGESRGVRQGDIAFAFGSPFDFRFSMSKGIVSGLGRAAGLDDIDYENFIQVDAAINPGNSGGPLTDARGHVIGMNTAIATGRGNTVGQGQFAGIGLAIPMSQIATVVEQIIETGEVQKGFLGVGLAEVSRMTGVRDGISRELMDAIRDQYDGEGVAVTRVEPGYPAAVAGIKSGDVIEEVDGRRVRGLEQLKSMISSGRPGDVVALNVWSIDGASGVAGYRVVKVTLGELDPIMSSPAAQNFRVLGLQELATSTPERAGAMGVEFRSGVIVLETDERSRLGGLFPAGTILIEGGGRAIASYDELLARFDRALQGGRGMRNLGFLITAIRPDGERVSVEL
ncbi:MAG: trypsin-like peptidase domain-containing protein [Phycisphaerales bacterium]|nr:trypsin-like peptidase domain-containing protein [Phycisphaerales bacterium]